MKKSEVELIFKARSEATKTIGELSDAVRGLVDDQRDAGNAFETTNEKVDRLRSKITELVGAERDLTTKSKLIESFKERQRQLLKTQESTKALIRTAAKLRAELKAAESESKAESKLAKQFDRASAAAQKSQAAIKKQRESLDQLGASLEKNGISLGKLGAAEKQLAADASSVVQRQNDLAVTLGRVKQEAAEAAGGIGGVANSSRKSVSAVKLLNREVKKLAAVSKVELIFQARSNAKETLAELSEAIAKLVDEQADAGKVFEGTTAKIDRQRAALDALVAAERKLTDKARLVETYKQQQRELSKTDKEARDLIVTARALRAALNESEEGSTERANLSAKFQQASAAAQQAQLNIRKQQAALRALKKELKANGIETRRLGAAEKQLAADAARVVRRQNGLTASLARLRKEAKAASGSLGNFGGTGRQSLSVVQRLRGEIVALTAAYVGFFAIGRGISSTFEVVRRQEAAQSRLRVFFDGDAEAAGRELQFIRGESERLALSFIDLADEYSKFLVAVPEGAFTLEETREIFSRVSVASRVLRLSLDDTRAVFKALTQIVSKGAVQMEELKGQLGDRLPGAVTLYAQAIGKSVRETVKLIENGEASAETLVDLARVLDEKFAGELPAALKGAAAGVQRFQNAVVGLQLDVGDSAGFVQTLAESLAEVTTELEKESTREGARSLAEGIATLVKWLVLLIQNIDSVIVAIQVLVGAKVFGFLLTTLTKVVVLVPKLIAGLAALRGASLATAISLRGLAAAGALASGPIGWAVALIALGVSLASTWKEKVIPTAESLRAELDNLQKSGEDLSDNPPSLDGLIESTEKAKKELKGLTAQLDALQSKRDNISFSQSQGNASLSDVLTGSDASKQIPRLQKKIKALEEVINAAQATITGAQTEELERKSKAALISPKKISELESQTKRANKAIDELDADTVQKKLAQIAASFDPILEKARAAVSAAEVELKRVEALGDDADKIDLTFAQLRAKQAGKDLEAVEKAFASKTRLVRLTEQKKLLAELQNLEDQAGVKAGSKLQGRLNETEKRYKRLIDRLNALGLIDQAKSAEKLLDNERSNILSDTRRELQRELLQLRAQDENDLDARLALVREKYEQLIKDLRAAGDVDGVKLAETVLEKKVTKTTDDQGSEVQARQEEKINELFSLRQTTIERINIERDAGLISGADAQRQLNELYGETNEQLLGMIEKAIIFAQSIGDEEAVQRLQILKVNVGEVADEWDKMRDSAKESFASGLSDGISDFIQGTKSAKEAFRGFAADFLSQIARMILKQAILNAISGGFGGGGSFGVAHTGGRVGLTAFPRRQVSAGLFANAPRYHSGGVVGLRADEQPSILQKGEEVLSKSDPRNVMNGGGNGGGGGGGNIQQTLVATLDPDSVIQHSKNSGGLKTAVFDILAENPGETKQLIGDG